jgi:hypothetical protein
MEATRCSETLANFFWWAVRRHIPEDVVTVLCFCFVRDVTASSRHEHHFGPRNDGYMVLSERPVFASICKDTNAFCR